MSITITITNILFSNSSDNDNDNNNNNDDNHSNCDNHNSTQILIFDPNIFLFSRGGFPGSMRVDLRELKICKLRLSGSEFQGNSLAELGIPPLSTIGQGQRWS